MDVPKAFTAVSDALDRRTADAAAVENFMFMILLLCDATLCTVLSLLNVMIDSPLLMNC